MYKLQLRRRYYKYTLHFLRNATKGMRFIFCAQHHELAVIHEQTPPFLISFEALVMN